MSSFSSSPFAHNNSSVQKIMLQVQLAAFPALLAHIMLFGYGIIIQWFLAVATALIVEFVMLKLRDRPVMPNITDFSALITITGLVFCIPPESPWWVIVTGSAFALIFGKHLYGGLGYNPFNPAMLGYAFLLISFPAEMTQWTLPKDLAGYTLSFWDSFNHILFGVMPNMPIDSFTGATPLSTLQTGLQQGFASQELLQAPYFESSWLNLTAWGWINMAFLIGGLWLIYTRTIRWQFPVGFLGALALMAWVFHMINPALYAPISFHLLFGGTMLAAFFIITDPVSSSTTPMGRLIYAAGIGILVYVIRNWGAFPDGIAFAVILMNIAVPMIDRYTQPRVVGHIR